ncbi:hypothetical protein O181_018195 [Austropuccinia psidii MF-1]|uniref:Integrase catalytic domain-containing protein n=1 Tax=Austropuccinia psidii MF-1 TaxID=1389203 RepID=A0A9Q3GTS8_9BASI|nr:hypothetical protein [Austropuccinia psidii MF-1]
MESHHDRTLKKLVSVHGGEFLNEKFNSLSRDCGFRHLFAPHETPQHNGFAERANRTMLDKALCMLGASNLPNMYWAGGVNTAAMLSNILPNSARLKNSPYTLCTGTSPKIQKLCTFGCRAIVTVLRNHRAWKLGATRCEEIFLGYKNRNTAYCVLRLSDSKFLTTKHVTFNQSIFPCLKDNDTTNPHSIIIEAPDPEITTETHPTKDPITEIDESQPLPENCNAPCEPEDDPMEEEEPSSNSLPELPPENTSRIRVIGPCHPTLVTSDINDINILPYSRRANTFVTSLGSTLRTFKAALDS